MDSDLLVENRIADGGRLIHQLMRDQFEVTVAFWVKTTEDGLWQLWLASNQVLPKKMGEALHKVYVALAKTPDCSVSPAEIRLLVGTDPIASDALALRDRCPSREPAQYRGKRLGGLDTAELCIYPRLLPLQVRNLPDGRWQVLISESDDLWLDCDSEDDARAIAAARVLEYEAQVRLKADPHFAAELERTAGVMEKYRMGFGSRRLRHFAQEMSRA